MKIKDTLIKIGNISQYDEIHEFLNSNGFKFVGIDFKSCLHVFVNSETKLYSHTTGCNRGSEHIDFKKFMEKYGMTDLQKKVEEVKEKLGLSNKELSLKLGHNPRYITNAILDKSPKRHADIIIKLEALLLKESGDLAHDFEGKSLHQGISDAIMISKDEYNELNKSVNDLNNLNADLFNKNSVKDFQINQLKKEIDHKTQVAEKHADMRAKAEAEAKAAIEKMLLAEQDSEKWQGDFWTVSRENIELTNENRCISIWLAIAILAIVVMAAYGVLHFNGFF